MKSINVGVASRGLPGLRILGKPGPSITITPVQPITDQSQPGDPVTDLSIVNGLDGQTYTFTLIDDASGAVEVVGTGVNTAQIRIVDALAASSPDTLTVRATPGAGDPIDLIVSLLFDEYLGEVLIYNGDSVTYGGAAATY